MSQLHNELSKPFFSKHEKEKSKLIEIHFLKEGGRDLKEKEGRKRERCFSPSFVRGIRGGRIKKKT